MVMTALLFLLAVLVIGIYVWTTLSKKALFNDVTKFEPQHKRSEALTIETAEELHPYVEIKEIDITQPKAEDLHHIPDDGPLTLEQQLAKIEETEHVLRINLIEELNKQVVEIQNSINQINAQLQVVQVLNMIGNNLLNWHHHTNEQGSADLSCQESAGTAFHDGPVSVNI